MTEHDAKWWDRYQYYLTTPDWQALRANVIQRDGYKCQGCFRPVTLHNSNGHHKSYVGYNRTGRSFGFEVVTLCRQCHDEYHQMESEECPF